MLMAQLVSHISGSQLFPSLLEVQVMSVVITDNEQAVEVSSTFLGPPIQDLFRSDPDGLGIIWNTPIPMFGSSFFPSSSHLTYPAPVSWISYCTLVPGNTRFPLIPCIVFAFLVFLLILLWWEDILRCLVIFTSITKLQMRCLSWGYSLLVECFASTYEI